jgi:hypothetical protein
MDPTLETSDVESETFMVYSVLSTLASILLYTIIYPVIWTFDTLKTWIVGPIWIVLKAVMFPFIRVGQLILMLMALLLRILAKFEVCET